MPRNKDGVMESNFITLNFLKTRRIRLHLDSILNNKSVPNGVDHGLKFSDDPLRDEGSEDDQLLHCNPPME